MNKKFIYFPSFSAGEMGGGLSKNTILRNDLPSRFYSTDFPEKYRHPYFLTTAGHFYKKKNFKTTWGFTDNPDVLLLGDSGGYQIAAGTIKWDKNIVPVILDWLECNSHIAMNLDIPPRLKYVDKFDECLDISIQNFKYFSENRSGQTKFLNVLQGNSDVSYDKWYNNVKSFDFDGWGIGGCGGSLYRFMAGIMVLLEGKEHYNVNNKYLHILGTSKIIDFLILSQLQKSLDKCNSKIQVTTDSSTPSRATVFGMFYNDANLRRGSFSSIHFPKERGDSIKNKSVHSTNSLRDSVSLMPEIIEFDTLLQGAYTQDDLINWTSEAYISLVLHNFMFFNSIIDKINMYVDGHPYILEQVINPDSFLILKSIDEMVLAYENGTTPRKVFDSYKQLYYKLSNTNIPTTTIQHSFF